MRVIYMFHADEPARGSVLPGSLPNPAAAYRGYVPLTLTQRTTAADAQHHSKSNGDNNDASQMRHSGSDATSSAPPEHTLELRNQDVELPRADETRFWCKVFELQDFRQKQHLIKVRLLGFFYSAQCTASIFRVTADKWGNRDELTLSLQFRLLGCCRAANPVMMCLCCIYS